MSVLAVLIPVLMGCQSMRGAAPDSQRCLASTASCEALLKPSLKDERVKLSYPSGDVFPLSPLTQSIVRNLELLNVPFELPKYNQPEAGAIAVELTLTQFTEAYESLPGGRELISIFAGEFETSEHLKQKLDNWVDRYIPGYALEWGYDGESTFIERGEFFDFLDRKKIPIANHHDLLVHLFLFSDLEIRSLTERLAAIYNKAVDYDLKFSMDHPSSNFSEVVNLLWVRLQENTPVEYQDAQGLRRLTVIGGFPSVIDPLQPFLGYFLDWIYFADIDDIYSKIDFEIKNKLNFEKREEAKKLYNESLAELQTLSNLPLKNFEQVLTKIDHEFNMISLATPDYQARWKEFSKRVIEGRGDPSLTLLRPEVHRRFIHKTLSLIEMILADK